MKPGILQNILSLFDENTTRIIAGRLAERHANVVNALERIIPTLLRGFASKSQEGPEAANALMQLAREANDNSWWQKVLDWMGDDDKARKGHEILQQLFGNSNIDRIGDAIAQKTMVRASSAVKLMQWAAPLCLATLGKEAVEKKYDASAMSALLAKEPIDIDGDGIAGGVPATTADTELAYAHSRKSSKPKTRMVVLLPLLLLFTLLALVLWLFKSAQNDPAPLKKVVLQSVHTANSNDHNAMPTYKLAEDSTVMFTYSEKIVQKLPNGLVLTIADNSAEALLIRRINEALQNGLDTTEESKKLGWVNLYDVQFVKGTTYRDGASAQMNNIAAILKAYPAIKIKIGGYTDNTGADEVNARISQERADKVKRDLSEMGIATQIVKAEGYGPQYPIADNTTREGRALNRRVSCRIVSVDIPNP